MYSLKDKLDRSSEELPLTTLDLYAYLNHYNIKGYNKPAFKRISCRDYKVTVLTLDVNEARGTVIILHGYLGHSGVMKNVINWLLAKNYNVVLYDMPGHGLSSGSAGGIDNFTTYGIVLKDVIEKATDPKLPLSIYAHSTGCSATIEFLHHFPQYNVDRIIFDAPLVRPVLWNFSISLTKALSFAIKWVPRVFRSTTHNASYNRFAQKKDPFQGRRASLSWVLAIDEWLKRVSVYEPLPHIVDIVQGTSDTVVDWRFNLPFLQRLLPNSKTTFIKGSEHEIHNEKEPFLLELFSVLERAFL